MYRSWDSLKVKSVEQLRDPARIRKLNRARGPSDILPAVGFATGGLVCAALSIFMFTINESAQLGWMGYAAAIFILLLAIPFFYGAKMFLEQRRDDIIHGFLKDPNKYEFIKGEISSAFFVGTDRKYRDHMIAEGKAFSPSGKELMVHEKFHYSIWQLKPPVAIHALCEKENPLMAALIGIDENLIQ